MRVRFVVAAIVSGTIALMVAPTPPIRSRLSWMDPVTGAMKWQYKTFGLALPATIIPSRLDERLASMGVVHQPQWKFLHDVSLSPFGNRYACGSAPEIYGLGTFPEMMKAYLDHATDDEVRALVRVLETGTDAERAAAVDAAGAKAMAALRE